MANRRERRWQLRVAKMLRIKNMYGPFTEVGQLWYNKTREEGRKLHAANVEANQQRLEMALSVREGNLKELYLSMGYSDAKVELLLEAWRIGAVKYKETYREDKKEIKRLLREAAQMN